MGTHGQQKRERNKTTAVLVWLLVILVLGLILAVGLYAREYVHQSFLAVAVEQPDLDRNEHVVQVTPVPETRDRTAAPVATTPAPTAMPTPTPSPVPTAVPTPTPTLNPLNGDVIGTGMRSPIVRDIQIRLMTLEYLDFEQPEDVYEIGVANAVALFQRRNDLPETGLCDEATFLKLNDEKAALYAVLPGDSGPEVEGIQERLVELGYLFTVDGFFSNETAQAVERFRTLNKLGKGTSVDSAVLETLFGDRPVSNLLRIGDRSDQVLVCQKRLLELGYLVTMPNGVYGKLTALAAKRLQEDNGLVADGNLSAGVVSLLNDEETEAHAFAQGARGDDVTAIQRLLHKYGYLSSGQITGKYRDATEEAVKEFQDRNGLEADGRVGPETLKKLLSDSVVAAPTPTPRPTPKFTAKATAKATKKATAKPTDPAEVIETPASGPETPAEPPETTPKATEPEATPKATAKATAKATNPPAGTYGTGVEGLIAAAQSRLGCPYVRGAKGPNSFDCSGFVYWCINQAGVKQSYMTSVRWRTCSKYTRITEMSELKRGDILVFSGKSSSTGHVGIYMGGGKMIDAGSSAGCVLIRSSINTTYWKSHFLMAYRIW